MLVFICYPHSAMRQKNYLLKRLRVLEQLHGITIWHDDYVDHGDNWRTVIHSKLEEADAAVVLVNADLLLSDFCQNVEIPSLLGRRDISHMPIYPVILEDSAWQSFEWLDKTQAGFRDPKTGRIKPWDQCEKHELATFSKQLTEKIAQNLERGTITAVPVHGRYLYTRDERQEAAAYHSETVACESVTGRRPAFQAYANDCLKLYQQNLYHEAVELAELFKSELDRRGTGAEALLTGEDQYSQIQALLEAGLPQNPPHFPSLTEVTIESLFECPGYATLMHGVRLTETNYSAAFQHLSRIHSGNLQYCALKLYALGQCLRKLGDLDEAGRNLRSAKLQISLWKQREKCSCGPGCSKRNLEVEVHRGLGAVLRKQKMWAEAQDCFRLATGLLNDVAPHVAADVMFSYGYLLFEWAYLAYHSLDVTAGHVTEADFWKRMSDAEELFHGSSQLRPEWSGPSSRIQYIKLLRGAADIVGLRDAAHQARLEQGVEALLTAINCEFAAQIAEIQFSVTGGDSERLFYELNAVLTSVLVASGPRSCHAFDNGLLLRGLKGSDLREWLKTKSLWLWRVSELLHDATQWPKKITLPEQMQLCAHFRQIHGIGESIASIV